MCGRFTLTVTMEELMLRFFIDQPANRYHQPRYNVAPGQMVIAIIHDGDKNRMGELKWGLIPEWAKDEKIGSRMLNARAETLTEKPAYQVPFQRKRCMIPADGFYEWKKTGNSKQPMRIMLKTKAVFGMAGLYDTWIAPDGRKIGSCTVITTEPNRLMQDIHDRMPVILRPEDEAVWLDRNNRNTTQLLSLLKPFPGDEMVAYPVSQLVGSVKNDRAECIEELRTLL